MDHKFFGKESREKKLNVRCTYELLQQAGLLIMLFKLQ